MESDSEAEVQQLHVEADVIQEQKEEASDSDNEQTRKAEDSDKESIVERAEAPPLAAEAAAAVIDVGHENSNYAFNSHLLLR